MVQLFDTMRVSKNKKPTASVNSRQRTKDGSTRTGGSSNVSNDGNNDGNNNNKPRNLLVLDATTPLQMEWQGRYGLHHSIIVHQRADEDTWPGGALWDLGLCMAQLVIALTTARGATTTPVYTTITMSPKSTREKGTGKSIRRKIDLPPRITEALIRHDCNDLFDNDHRSTKGIVLELGCGVGLTGLVTAMAIRPKATILTDLEIVIDQVTRRNVELNTIPIQSSSLSLMTTNRHCGSSLRTTGKGHGDMVVSTPLCWGNTVDEDAVIDLMKAITQNAYPAALSKGKCKPNSTGTHQQTDAYCPPYNLDLVLIGDVAYQHKPGAPSHFDALLSTLLKLVDNKNNNSRTMVLFGTRMRMPASGDLLDMLLEEFDEIVQLSPEEIDPSTFANVKHGMSIHILKRKKIAVEKPL